MLHEYGILRRCILLRFRFGHVVEVSRHIAPSWLVTDKATTHHAATAYSYKNDQIIVIESSAYEL